MNKNLKHIIAVMLAVGTISTFGPSIDKNILLTKAYASSDIYLKGITVVDGDDITLSKNKKNYKTAVPNTTETATIRVLTNSKNDKVTIDGAEPEQKSSTKYVAEVNLEKGNNDIEIVVKSDDGDDERIYTLRIDRGGKESTDSESVFLDTINLDEGDIEFSKNTTKYDIQVDEDIDKIRVQAKPENTRTKVYIEGNQVDEDKKYRKEVKLYKGDNTIVIDLEDEDDDSNTKRYTLNVYRGKKAESQSTVDTSKFDNSQDEIYLDNIVLNDGDTKLTPNFNKKITNYAVDVDSDVESIIVKGETEYDANIVKINGVTADSKNRKRVTLNEGKNEIEVKVNNDCDSDSKDYLKRIYKITVYRGTSEGTSATDKAVSSNNSGNDNNDKKNDNKTEQVNNQSHNNNNNNNNNENNSTKINQWVNVMGKWQYNDVSGNPLKNTWFYDNNFGKTYYLDSDGNMSTGWIVKDGSWYYLDQSGAKQIGWKQLGTSWYYFDNEGKMKTGWFLDSNGKYYYFYDSGAMAFDTNIGGYKLGFDGSWKK